MIAALALMTGVSSFAGDIVLAPFHGMEDVFVFDNKVEVKEFCMKFIAPDYIIYPDSRCSLEQAQALVEELGFAEGELFNWMSRVTVVNPVSDRYDAKADGARYEQIFNALFSHCNLKIVAIGNGATFVNESIAPIANEVAGIVSISGKAPSKITGAATVPVYVAGKNAKAVARYYRKRNSVSGDPLLVTVEAPSGDMSLSQIMEDAWESVLSRNIRISNYGHTSYLGERLGQYPFELQQFAYPKALGLKKNIVEKDFHVISGKKYLWFEYFNDAVENAPEGTVPLLVLLHGNHNDPRTQADFAGFLPLAARENFMVIELEWQGGKDGAYAWMGLDGIELTVNEVLDKYPQLDRSRVYAQGLSAGAFTTTALGVHKPYLFAALAAQSGGVVNDVIPEGAIYGAGYNRKSLFADAKSRRGSILMPYFSVSGTADGAIPHPSGMDFKDTYPAGISLPDGPVLAPEESFVFKAWQLYQTLNGAEVAQNFEAETDAFFGQELSGRTSSRIGNYDVESGDIIVDGVPVMRLVTVQNFGHWNFVPAAEMEWEYFKHFSRDPETKKLNYTE